MDEQRRYDWRSSTGCRPVRHTRPAADSCEGGPCGNGWWEWLGRGSIGRGSLSHCQASGPLAAASRAASQPASQGSLGRKLRFRGDAAREEDAAGTTARDPEPIDGREKSGPGIFVLVCFFFPFLFFFLLGAADATVQLLSRPSKNFLGSKIAPSASTRPHTC